MERIAIIGYSGHAYVVLDTCKKAGISVQYYCEKKEVEDNSFCLDYVGDERTQSFDWDKIDAFVLGVGSNIVREQVSGIIHINHKRIITVVHPTAVIGNLVTIGDGTVITANSTINPLAKIGVNCIINTGAILEHECFIGNNSHIAPGAVLAGRVAVGNNCLVGANSIIKQGVRIGDNVTIGAGSVVLKDISDNEIWVGNPAKKLNVK